ncbi:MULTISPECIES: cyanate transporter [unclassified Methylophaga]|jgi:CP family cyanate transporter-like MFS transporter|uniref:MFS transporter n=2 Tax=Gammaproteobacteria TaxID=1236 RepID=A0A2T4CYL8_9GAMM|nr:MULTISPECIES: cyanate transporter [unclassified Methylophaga]MAL50545.1 MFS transporter [Methylophaga sp.]MBP25157.1 MFS transporter [Methylophaga sp.]PTB86661.1 MFS transporter [Pseudidiomarina aestuarii]|tara:strand:- start:1944 stop:3143 length:1200 start_codon:yes stop_codon:yes gene_type:complete
MSAREHDASALQKIIFAVVIVLVALNLRPILASVGPLLPAIQQDITLSFKLASLLTTLPVFAMGLFCLAGYQLAHRFGVNQIIVFSIVLIVLSAALRLWAFDASNLIITALLAGLGIALIQALMPMVIKNIYGSQHPRMMGLYITGIMLGAAISASISPFIEAEYGWRMGLGSWSLLALIALIAWWFYKPDARRFQDDDAQIVATPGLWRNRRSWYLAIFFSLGSSCYVCVLAWLSPYAIEQGYTAKQAGLMLGLLTAMEVVAGLLFPALSAKNIDRRRILYVLCTLQIIGFGGMAFRPDISLWLWSAIAGLGIGGIFPMALIVTMDHQTNSLLAGKLAGFVQGIGSMIAAIAPWIAGWMRDSLQSFTMAWVALTGLGILALLMARAFNPSRYVAVYPH